MLGSEIGVLKRTRFRFTLQLVSLNLLDSDFRFVPFLIFCSIFVGVLILNEFFKANKSSKVFKIGCGFFGFSCFLFVFFMMKLNQHSWGLATLILTELLMIRFEKNVFKLECLRRRLCMTEQFNCVIKL